MKRLVILFGLIFVSTLSFTQTTTWKDTLSHQELSEEYLIRAGKNLSTSVGLTIVGGTMLGLGASGILNYEAKDYPYKEKKGFSTVFMVAGGGLMFTALIMQITGYSQIKKAGIEMRNARINLGMTNYGIGVRLKI